MEKVSIIKYQDGIVDVHMENSRILWQLCWIIDNSWRNYYRDSFVFDEKHLDKIDLANYDVQWEFKDICFPMDRTSQDHRRRGVLNFKIPLDDYNKVELGADLVEMEWPQGGYTHCFDIQDTDVFDQEQMRLQISGVYSLYKGIIFQDAYEYGILYAPKSSKLMKVLDSMNINQDLATDFYEIDKPTLDELLNNHKHLFCFVLQSCHIVKKPQEFHILQMVLMQQIQCNIDNLRNSSIDNLVGALQDLSCRV